MKGFVVVLLCALATVEPRYTGLSERSPAALGENPSVVHLRLATSSSGLLNTGAGTLINNRWLVTAASAVTGISFGWNRFGLVNVINPSLVIESARVTVRDNIALLDLNRNVQFTDNIAPAKLSENSEIPDSGKVCVFGATESGQPGEILNCSQPGDAAVSRFDLGAGRYNDDGELVAVLTGVEGGAQYTPIAGYLDWIKEQTGLSL